MKLFLPTECYSKADGSRQPDVYQWQGIICDWCGTVYTEIELDIRPSYSIHEYSGMEHTYHEDQLHVDGHLVDLYELNHVHREFHFCKPWEWGLEEPHGPKTCEEDFLRDAAKSRYDTIAEALYKSRYRIISTILDNKVVTPEELQLEYR